MRSYLITGGTGSFGNALVPKLLERDDVHRVVVYSRDELKQSHMRERFSDERLRFFLGNVRDRRRLTLACTGITHLVHAAALKQVPACEYNPEEAIKTNIFGAINVVHAAIATGVRQVVALSTDKACNPVNLYGATKLCSEKTIVGGNILSGRGVSCSVVRYGNIAGSRGSIIPKWLEQARARAPFLTLTNRRMTRFWFTLPEAVEFTLSCAECAVGGEIFVPKLEAYTLGSLASAIVTYTGRDDITFRTSGHVRPGEKFHEAMIGPDEAHLTQDFGSYCAILPHPDTGLPRPTVGTPVPERWSLSSDGVSLLRADAIVSRLHGLNL